MIKTYILCQKNIRFNHNLLFRIHRGKGHANSPLIYYFHRVLVSALNSIDKSYLYSDGILVSFRMELASASERPFWAQIHLPQKTAPTSCHAHFRQGTPECSFKTLSFTPAAFVTMTGPAQVHGDLPLLSQQRRIGGTDRSKVHVRALRCRRRGRTGRRGGINCGRHATTSNDDQRWLIEIMDDTPSGNGVCYFPWCFYLFRCFGDMTQERKRRW